VPSQLPNFYFDVLANSIGHYNKNTKIKKKTLKAQLIFHSKPNFCKFWLNFPTTKLTQKSLSSTP
jgi:hypothetical protein